MSYILQVRVEKTDDYREWIDALKDTVGRVRIGDKDIEKAISLAKNFQE
jgi:putative component of toxin-antitoxin plasmid stabilization module